MMVSANTGWLILFAPLIAAAAGLALRKAPKLAAAVSTLAVLASFVLSLALLQSAWHGHIPEVTPIPWLSIGSIEIELGLLLDNLSILMLVVVTGIGLAVHIYSWTYMAGDDGFGRYFSCLSLFTFSMLGIVLSTNFVQMYIFWELVGLSSYLLIGFWFDRDAAADAARKAFLANRVGDAGFLLGILSIWTLAGTVSFSELSSSWGGYALPATTAAVIAILIFCGTVGKSAQLPLHVWLPDAMEGPTPVSALIHAATMVAAGVYLLCRVSWLFAADTLAADVVAWVGGITALFAALIAVAQNDIKRILAYSTLSQLGYMVMAAGLGGAGESMFHLTTHAFFKALLFLCAGSVILALHHEQDIWKMGGLAKRMPVTFLTFLLGTLALAGIWPLSGFYSKDAILLLAQEENKALFWIGEVTAFLTAFYMGRCLCVAFLGKARDEHAVGHAREQGPAVVVPLVVLAVLTVASGWGHAVPSFLAGGHGEGAAHASSLAQTLKLLALPVLGLVLSVALYGRASPSDDGIRKVLGPLHGLLRNKFYVDELYACLIRGTQDRLAAGCDAVERSVLQPGLVRGTGWLAYRGARLLRHGHSGNMRIYAWFAAFSAFVLIYFVLFP